METEIERLRKAVERLEERGHFSWGRVGKVLLAIVLIPVFLVMIAGGLADLFN